MKKTLSVDHPEEAPCAGVELHAPCVAARNPLPGTLASACILCAPACCSTCEALMSPETQAAITNDDPNPGAPGRCNGPVTVQRARPGGPQRLHALRPPVADFTGRTTEVAHLV